MLNPGHRYIHALWTRSIGGRQDSTGSVTRSDLLMLYSIIEHYPIHLGHLLAELLYHQGTHSRLGAIFAGPFITRLIKGMGLLDQTQGMKIVGSMTPLGVQTLVSMGIIERVGDRIRLVQTQGARAQDPGPSQETDTESESEAEPSGARSHDGFSFGEFRDEVRAQIQSLDRGQQEFRAEVRSQIQGLERGHQEIITVHHRLERDLAEILSFIRGSSSSVGTASAASTHSAPSLTPDP